MNEEIRYLGDLQKITLGPTDVLVLSVDEYLSQTQTASLIEGLRRVAPLNKAVVLQKGMKLGVVSIAA